VWFLLVTASVVPSSPIRVTLMMDALSSFETSVLTRTTRRIIPEDAILLDLVLETGLISSLTATTSYNHLQCHHQQALHLNLNSCETDWDLGPSSIAPLCHSDLP
jgi:hypothetical protein